MSAYILIEIMCCQNIIKMFLHQVEYFVGGQEHRYTSIRYVGLKIALFIQGETD